MPSMPSSIRVPAILRGLKIPFVPRWMQRRIGFMIMVLCAAIVIQFIIPRAMPGDFTTLYLSSDMSPEVVEATLERLGLNESMWTQFWKYVTSTVTFRFGNSFAQPTTSVASMIGERIPRTLALLLPAQIVSVAIGYLLGVTAGWRAGSKQDSFIIGASLIIWAMPMFWTAMIILYVGGYMLDWFPLGGYKTIGAEFGFWRTFADRLYYLFLPTVTLITKFGASTLVMRNTMTITLKQNYVTTARAKGLSERRVKHRHAARNALMPTVTAVAMRFATLIAGMIFIEKIFSYPGMGKLIFDSVQNMDFPVLQASFFIFTLMVLFMIFLLDIIYARLDPRVRYE